MRIVSRVDKYIVEHSIDHELFYAGISTNKYFQKEHQLPSNPSSYRGFSIHYSDGGNSTRSYIYSRRGWGIKRILCYGMWVDCTADMAEYVTVAIGRIPANGVCSNLDCYVDHYDIQSGDNFQVSVQEEVQSPREMDNTLVSRRSDDITAWTLARGFPYAGRGYVSRFVDMVDRGLCQDCGCYGLWHDSHTFHYWHIACCPVDEDYPHGEG